MVKWDVAKTRNRKRNRTKNGKIHVIRYLFDSVKHAGNDILYVILKKIINMISFIHKMYDFLKINRTCIES